MVQVSYPGVYIQEVPSGVHTITSVATSITAFIDFFKQGPMNEAVEIFGMTDFQRVFGGLDDRSEASYAISQFFLNGGGTALVIRVAAGAAKAGITLHLDGDAAKKVLDVTAGNEGLWSNNLRIDVDYDTIDPATLFNLTATLYDGPDAKAKPIAVERFLNLTMDTAKPRYAPKVISDASNLIQAAPGANATTTSRPAANGTISGSLALTQTKLDDLGKTPAKKIDVTIGALTGTATLDTWGAGAVTSLKQLAQRIQKAIQAANPSPSFTGATVAVYGNRLCVLSGKASPSYNTTELVQIADAAGDDTASKVLALALTTATNEDVQQDQLTGGADGSPPGASEIIGAPGDPPTGMFALDRADLFNILCIPLAAKLGDSDMNAVVSAALKYCDDRRAFMIIDVPEHTDTVQKMKDWLDQHDGFRNNNAAVYFPHPRILDPKNEFRLRSVGASGTMSGIYARTDSARGVWKAPAGIEASLSGVAELDVKLTDAQNGTLNPLGINCLRSFPIYGGIAWGARTLEGADQIGSEWKYIPIRRLALMLEESLFRGTKWVVFEPNDEPLWAKIRLNINAYMMSLFRQGAFQGTNPKDAFFVKCDSETTTQDDRNKGIVNILVGFAPLKPAEFVVISIQQIAGNL
jgi:phage tail sheath protein FI